ncbi:MAG TPA: ATP-binding protein [Burkholderiaceae bacterium]|nr:ATP-binding protein [Burkholderiaceae bacterium]
MKGEDWLRTVGPMSDAIRRHDWGATPLGPIGRWPLALRLVVANLLASGQPTYLAYGPRLVSIYNDAYVPILGERAEGALGRPFPELWSESWEQVKPLVDEALSGRGTWREDLPIRLRRHGVDEVAHFTFSYAPVFDESGAPAGMIATIVETTRRVRIEQALRVRDASRAYRLALSEALREIDDPLAVQATAARMLGEHLRVDRVAYGDVTPEGTHIDLLRNHLAPGTASIVGRFRMSEFGTRLVERLRRGATLVVPDVEAADDMLPSESAAFASIGVRSLVNVPLVKSGRLVAALLVHCGGAREWSDVDVALIEETAERTWAAAERARAESERRRAEVRRAQAMAAARLGSWDVDVATGTVSWDEHTARLLGVPVERRDEYASRWLERIHPDDRGVCIERFGRLLDGQEDLDVEFRALTVDGRARWFRSTGTLVRDESGAPDRIVGVTQDVTERREAEQVLRDSERALRENDRRKDEFLAMLGHELRGPLAPIRTALTLFERETLSEHGRRSLAVSQRQLRQLVRLVDDLLEASRALQGMIEVRPEPALAQHVVEAAVEAVEPLLAERGQRVELDAPATPVRLNADPVRLAQIVENLLTNASKYSDPGTSIHVSVGEDHGSVAIEVRDRGVGIAPDQMANLFQPFSQIDATIDRSRGGLGLGLALVRRLAELHGGSVSARSPGLGLGSTFSVRLPRSGPAQ